MEDPGAITWVSPLMSEEQEKGIGTFLGGARLSMRSPEVGSSASLGMYLLFRIFTCVVGCEYGALPHCTVTFGFSSPKPLQRLGVLQDRRYFLLIVNEYFYLPERVASRACTPEGLGTKWYIQLYTVKISYRRRHFCRQCSGSAVKYEGEGRRVRGNHQRPDSSRDQHKTQAQSENQARWDKAHMANIE